MENPDTIVAAATPAGEAAIALVRVSGPLCGSLAGEALGVSAPTPRHATLAEYRDGSGKVLDKVLFTFFANEASYTGDPMLEIGCHGSPYIVQQLIEDLLARGCRLADPGEFTRTAFLNGRMDLSQAEAVIDVIRARGEHALDAAQKQLSGSVGNAVNQLVDNLLQVIAEVEAYIDFPDEDLPDESTGPAARLDVLHRDMQRLIATSHYSTLLHDGVKTVIIGAPNAGKSSLLNALMQQERAIVSAEPGTTRDFIEERIIVGPYVVRVIDTAGLHEPDSAIEKLGIDKTLEQAARADFFLVVVDAAEQPPALPDGVARRLNAANAIVVVNKTDLPGADDFTGFLPDVPHCGVSALSGDGLEALQDAIIAALETDLFLPTADSVIVSARHADALRTASASAADARAKLTDGGPGELVASDLRLALDALGAITGRIDNERMLDRLFATFCIGK